jgi:tagatose 6-phosphate kinase
VNRAAEAHWCSSGKVLNVGIALAQLGGRCRVISPVGRNVEAEVEAEMKALGAELSLIVCEQPTRVCTTLIDSATGTVTELVENARPLDEATIRRVTERFSSEVTSASAVVMTGSLPAGTPTSFYRDLVETTRSPTVLDIRGPELLEVLPLKPFLIKPNREELAKTVHRPLDGDSALIDSMRQLNSQGAQWVVITDGTRPLWVSSDEGAFRAQPLLVENVVNPIGCGDCLAAGIAWGLAAGRPPLDSIALGIAAAAQNATQLLPGRIDEKMVIDQSQNVVFERA